MIDLDTTTASQAVAALAQGSLGSAELLEAHLARVERDNGAVNAVVAFDVDRARAQAVRADEDRAAGRSQGPLHGLPMTIKDAFETEGLTTTSGAPELADHVPERDADAVARLKAAGAIVFAKTNLPLYAGDMQTYNELFGRTNNPWDLSRTSGGSSGGAAAALATGMTLLELGSDIGGSIRNPSHYCGVFGHKPTWGVVPQRGHIPGPPGVVTPADLNVVGPMGRSVADLMLGLDVLAGTDPLGLPGGVLPPAPARVAHPGQPADASGWRIGLWLADPAAPTDRAVLERLEATAAALEAAGATVVDDVRTPTSLEDQHLVYLHLLTSVVAGGYPDEVIEFSRQMADALDPEDRSRTAALTRGTATSHRDWKRANEQRHRVRLEWADVFEQVDVMLTPVTPVVAPLHDTERPLDQRVIQIDGQDRPYMDQLVWAGLATMPFLPVTVVPVGRTAADLPVGVQIMGPHAGDRTTLAAGACVEALMGGFTAPPTT